MLRDQLTLCLRALSQFVINADNEPTIKESFIAGYEAGVNSPLATGNAPVAYRVKDFGDGWILFNRLHEAQKEAKRAGGAKIEQLFTQVIP